MIQIFKKLLGLRNHDKENIELIRKSKYFDEKYYLLDNPDVKGDACTHYYYYGWKEGRSPSFDFSNDYYLKNYKDVEDAGINPLLHYIKFGKTENRLIEKDNGLSLKKIYEKFYQCPYFYRTYICDDDIKRVNLFFDEINDSVSQMGDLIHFVISFCKHYQYQLRIIYYMADFEAFSHCLEVNKLSLPDDTVFLNLKSSNYLEVGLEEKYICTSWKNARAILNTASINTNIYFYLNDTDNMSKEEYYQVSNICMNEHVICLVRDDKELKNIKQCQLKFEVNSEVLVEKENNQMYCDFDGMFIVGVEILNAAFLTGVLNSNIWKVNIFEHEKDFKFHFDTNVRIQKVEKMVEDADLIFQMSYSKKVCHYDMPAIQSWVEEKEIPKKNYINITQMNSFSKMADKPDFSLSKIDTYYTKFRNCIEKIKKEG